MKKKTAFNISTFISGRKEYYKQFVNENVITEDEALNAVAVYYSTNSTPAMADMARQTNEKIATFEATGTL